VVTKKWSRSAAEEWFHQWYGHTICVWVLFYYKSGAGVASAADASKFTANRL
jgi:hypothetical protein